MSDEVVEVDSVSEMRLLHRKSDPDFIVLRIETQGGKRHNFGLNRAGLLSTIEQWRSDLPAAGAGDDSEPATVADEAPLNWEQLTFLMATIMLPMAKNERQIWLVRAAQIYVRCMHRAGHDDAVIDDNLPRMIARVTECVDMLDSSGGAVGNA